MYGFAVWIRPGDAHPIDAVTRTSGALGGVSGPWFGMYARPRQSTPEATTVHQPLVTPNLLLVYSGRIDNRAEVAERLGKPELATAADGEVFAAAYAAWGDELCKHFTGEFAFAVLDRQRPRIVAGRDALGVHKLFTFERGGRYWVASDLSVLLALLPEAPALDAGALADFIGCGGTLGPLGNTVYAGIHELPHGHVIVYGSGARVPHRSRYWSPDVASDLEFGRVEAYEERFRQLLSDAVAASLRSSGPICVDLSGGLDSSTVAAMAARLASEGPQVELLAYSLVASKTKQADERAFQAAFLNRYPIEHHTFDMDTMADVPDVVDVAQPAFVDAQRWMLEGQRALARARAPHVGLTGIGGDNVFCYALPPLHLAQLLSRGRLIRWWRDLGAWSLRYSLWNLLWVFSRGDTMQALGPLPLLPDWISPTLRDRVEVARRSTFMPPTGRFLRNGREYHQHIITSVTSVMPEASRMPWEPRCPLLARPLVEFMLRVPLDAKVTVNENRILQRRALRDILPEQIVRRHGKGDFTARFYRGVRRSWVEWEPLTRGERLADLGLIDPAHFRRACEQVRDGIDEDRLSFVTAALILETWLRDRRAPSLGENLRSTVS